MRRTNVNRDLRQRMRRGATLAVGLGALLLAAPPASARDEFGRGFENELGRIMAHAAVSAGFGLLHAATGPHHYGPPPIVVQEVHYRGHGHHKHKHKHRGHGYCKDHDYHGYGHYKHRGYDHYRHPKRHYYRHLRDRYDQDYGHRGRHRYDDDDDDHRRRSYHRGIPRHELDERVYIERRGRRGDHARYRH